MTSTARKSAYFRRSSLSIVSAASPGSSTGTSITELEESLHDLLETALQCYVNSWYPNISPRDRTFLPHIYQLLVRVLASLSINIHTACDAGRLDELVLLDIPEIISTHLDNWIRAESDVLRTRSEKGDKQALTDAIAARYALLYGHPAVQQVQPEPVKVSPFLKTADYGTNTTQLPNDVDRSLGEAMSSSLHGDGYTIHRHRHPTPAPVAPIGQDGSETPALPPVTTTPTYRIYGPYLSTLSEGLLRSHLPPADYRSPTERAIITEILGSAILSNVLQKISQGWMINKLMLAILGEPGKRPDSEAKSESELPDEAGSRGVQSLLFKGYHSVVLLVHQFASLLLMLSSWYTLLQTRWKTVDIDVSPPKSGDKTDSSHPQHWTAGIDDALRPSLLMLDSLMDLLPGARPPRQSLAEIRTWLGIACGPIALGRYADKLLPVYMHNHLFKPAVVTRVTKIMHEILFPNGEIAPSVPDPSEAEVKDLSDRLVARLLEVFPLHARRLMIGTNSQSHSEAIRRLIAPFQDPQINLHLFTRLLEAIILTIEPRLVNDLNDET